MKQAGWLLVAGVALAAPLRAQAPPQNPLRHLHADKGAVVVEYQRATASADAFARLADTAQPARLQVSLAAGTPAHAGEAVATAYLDGLAGALPAMAVGDAGQAAGYQLEIAVSDGRSDVEASEKVYGYRHAGVSCNVSPSYGVSCGELGGGVPVSTGTRPVQATERTLDVVLRMHRLVQGGKRSPVFEDSYTLRYLDGACSNDIAAAATIARALGKAAVLEQPLNIRFDSAAKPLLCDRG